MTWFKVDDTLAFHRKTIAAGNAAMGLWVRAGSWASWQLTDGFVPDDMVAALGNTAQAKRLVAVHLWERVDGGYQFWQWNEPGRQPTREQVEQDRAAARERMQRIRTGKRSSPERSPEHEPNEQRSSRAVRQPRPDPSRPEGEGQGSVDKSPSRRNARTTPDDDRDSTIDARIVDLLRELTGRTVDAEHAAAVRRRILDGRHVDNPIAYVTAAIRGAPRDHLPASTTAPPVAEARRAAGATGPGTDPNDDFLQARERLGGRT